MEKIVVVGCKRAMDDGCIGCSRCMVAFNRKEGEDALINKIKAKAGVEVILGTHPQKPEGIFT
jgi:hypothetical protein